MTLTPPPQLPPRPNVGENHPDRGISPTDLTKALAEIGMKSVAHYPPDDENTLSLRCIIHDTARLWPPIGKDDAISASSIATDIVFCR